MKGPSAPSGGNGGPPLDQLLSQLKEENAKLSVQLQNGYQAFNDFKVKKGAEMKEIIQELEELRSKVGWVQQNYVDKN